MINKFAAYSLENIAEKEQVNISFTTMFHPMPEIFKLLTIPMCHMYILPIPEIQSNILWNMFMTTIWFTVNL